jgi:hypothetical protein
VIGRQAGIEDRGGHKQCWFVFRRPCSTPARPPAQAAKGPAPAPAQKPPRDDGSLERT